MTKPIRHAVLSVRNVCDRIANRLRQLEPQMHLLYAPSLNRYQLFGASAEPITIELQELLGLWRFLGTRHEYDEVLVMRAGARSGPTMRIFDEKPLSKRKHFHWISKLELCAREKLTRGVQMPGRLDLRGLLDDMSQGGAPAAPEQPVDAELPEPDEDFQLPASDGLSP